MVYMGGIFGEQTARVLFFLGGEGTRMFDVDGRNPVGVGRPNIQ